MERRIAVGQAVYDADGNKLGTVKAIQDAYFAINAPLEPDYWVRMESVAAEAGDRLLLVADAEHVADPPVSPDAPATP